jgi:hypothetical protein
MSTADTFEDAPFAIRVVRRWRNSGSPGQTATPPESV